MLEGRHSHIMVASQGIVYQSVMEIGHRYSMGLGFDATITLNDHYLAAAGLSDRRAEAVDADALQHPGRVHAVRVQRVRDDLSFGAGRALTDAKRGADLCHGHVRLGRLVRQEVELAQYVDDAASPGARLPRGQRAWALA
jgi:hypothetical protein